MKKIKHDYEYYLKEYSKQNVFILKCNYLINEYNSIHVKNTLKTCINATIALKEYSKIETINLYDDFYEFLKQKT